jgi:hypothetical protein
MRLYNNVEKSEDDFLHLESKVAKLLKSHLFGPPATNFWQMKLSRLMEEHNNRDNGNDEDRAHGTINNNLPARSKVL